MFFSHRGRFDSFRSCRTVLFSTVDGLCGFVFYCNVLQLNCRVSDRGCESLGAQTAHDEAFHVQN